MSGTPPVRREGDQLRGELLAAASRLSAGPRPVAIPSLRAVARECSVSAAAVYRHFPSQNALTWAVLKDEYYRFEATLLDIDDPAADPLTRLRALSLGYVGWGLDNPGIYQLLFESAEQLDPDAAYHGATNELYRRLDALLDALELGRAPDGIDARALAGERLMAGLHGVVSLAIHKSGQRWTVPIEHLVDGFLPPATNPKHGGATLPP